MKQTFLIFLALISFLFSLSINNNQTGFITGSVQPSDAVLNVQAIIAKDTFAGSIRNNAFEISKLRNGNYSLFIEARSPYKNFLRTNIKVTDGQVTNVGDIKLSQ